jgi:hypothetical protein
MFKMHTDQGLPVIALLLEEFTKKAKGKRIWIHKSLHEKKSEREYFTLHKELLDDEVTFRQYNRNVEK